MRDLTLMVKKRESSRRARVHARDAFTDGDYLRRQILATAPPISSRLIAAGSGTGVELSCMSSNMIASPGGPLGKPRFSAVNSTLLTGVVLLQPNQVLLFT